MTCQCSQPVNMFSNITASNDSSLAFTTVFSHNIRARKRDRNIGLRATCQQIIPTAYYNDDDNNNNPFNGPLSRTTWASRYQKKT